jgi:hypothetical protein
MKLTGKTKVLNKVLLISVPFLIPICALFFLIFQYLSKQIEIGSTQVEGLEYISQAQNLLKVIQEHRVKSVLFIESQTPYNKVSLLQNKGVIDVTFNTLQSSNRMVGETFKTVAAFNEVEKKWMELSKESLHISSLEYVQGQTRFIGDYLFPFINLIANSAHFPYELDAKAFYAYDLLIVKLPNLTEDIGRVQSYGIASLEDGVVDDKEQGLLTFLISIAEIDFHSLENTFELFIKAAPEYEIQMRPLYLDLADSMNQYFIYVKENMLKKAQTQLQPFPYLKRLDFL